MSKGQKSCRLLENGRDGGAAPAREKKDAGKDRNSRGRREAYVAPEISVLGTVEELTQALGTGTKDGLNGSTVL